MPGNPPSTREFPGMGKTAWLLPLLVLTLAAAAPAAPAEPPMVRQAGRPGKPEDIAGPAFFFCSDDSQYVTGQVMLVDGGISATF